MSLLPRNFSLSDLGVDLSHHIGDGDALPLLEGLNFAPHSTGERALPTSPSPEAGCSEGPACVARAWRAVRRRAAALRRAVVERQGFAGGRSPLGVGVHRGGEGQANLCLGREAALHIQVGPPGCRPESRRRTRMSVRKLWGVFPAQIMNTLQGFFCGYMFIICPSPKPASTACRTSACWRRRTCQPAATPGMRPPQATRRARCLSVDSARRSPCSDTVMIPSGGEALAATMSGGASLAAPGA